MIEIYTRDEMQGIDRELEKQLILSQVIERAGFGVAIFATRILGSCYGKRIVVIIGKGNNGRDGSIAANYLRSWGAKVDIIAYSQGNNLEIPNCDLVIDAVFGSGFRGTFSGITYQGDAKVLAVDLVSGLDCDTGEVKGNVRPADFTLGMAGAKLGYFLGDGVGISGETYLYDLGLDLVTQSKAHLVFPDDVAMGNDKDYQSHKWKSGVAVFAGSPNMAGAALLVSAAAMRSGAGIVHLFSDASSFGIQTSDPEVVLADALYLEDSVNDWQRRLGRFKAVVVGPGLSSQSGDILSRILKSYYGPIVIDADAITAISKEPELIDQLSLSGRKVILTPHAAELERLSVALGFRPTHKGLTQLASNHNLFLLVKGFPTRLYTPNGHLYVLPSNPSTLATAGTGDVLAGVIAGSIARWGASDMVICHGITIHAIAAKLNLDPGMVAYDVVRKIPSARQMVESWPKGSPTKPFWPLQTSGPLLFASDSKINWGSQWAQS